jgi:UPF0755 protein
MKNFAKTLLFLFIAFDLVIAVAGFYIYTQFQPVNASATDTVEFVIPKGQATSIIANRLQEEKIIKNALVFRVLAKLDGFESQMQSGTFELSPAMTPSQVGEALTKGTEDVWITLLEGWRVEEIAESIAQEQLPFFDADEFISLAKSDEGKMYPDSYLIPRQYTAEQVHSLLLNTFETKVIDSLADEIAASERDFEDVLIMASIVEREGRGLEQMRQVAGILWNRVDIGMPIQADATLQYIAGYNKTEKSWWAQPDVSVKSVQSPYNTYLNPGLPPRPISNPSADAIRATLEPTESDYLFYIHDREGKMHYAVTLDEHNENINKYLR